MHQAVPHKSGAAAQKYVPRWHLQHKWSRSQPRLCARVRGHARARVCGRWEGWEGWEGAPRRSCTLQSTVDSGCTARKTPAAQHTRVSQPRPHPRARAGVMSKCRNNPHGPFRTHTGTFGVIARAMGETASMATAAARVERTERQGPGMVEDVVVAVASLFGGVGGGGTGSSAPLGN